MAGTGQFHVTGGGQLFTTYEPTSEGCSQLINDFYNGGWQAFHSGFARSVGNAVFDGGFGSTGGMFVPKFGQDVTASMFTSKTIFGALPKRAYDHEGMRLLTRFATYGTAADYAGTGITGIGSMAPSTFLGLGAATAPDGQLPPGVTMQYDLIRIPYKENPLKFNYGLGLKAMEGKDDTATYKQYIDFIKQNYNDLADKTVLRSIGTQMPKVGNLETTMNGLARIFSSGEELDTSKTGALTNANLILPWGGINGDMAGGYYVDPGDNAFNKVGDANARQRAGSHTMPNGQGRAQGITWSDDGTVTGYAHTKNNYDAQIVDAEGSVPALGMFDELYMKCLTNWEGDYSDKCWIMSPLQWNKLNQLCKANNIYVDSMYTTMTMHGMKTNEGRDVGMALNSYMNIPIIMSGNMAFDYAGAVVNTAMYGDTFLLDLKHTWLCMTSPMEVWTIENPAITNDLMEHNVTNMRCEVRADKFITSGRLKNVGASA